MKKTIPKLIVALLLATGFLLQSSDLKAQIATIGTGTDDWVSTNPISMGGFSFGFPPRPVPKNNHHQLIYTAAEINAAGITGPKLLDSIAWQVAGLPEKALKSYSIKMKNTPLKILDSFISFNLTAVTNIPSYMPVMGWSWIKFQTPFYWNGVDNLLFDICRDTLSATPDSITGKIFTSMMADEKDVPWFSASSVDPLCGVYTGGSALSVKANIKMAFRAAAACTGMPVTGIIIPSAAQTGCSGMGVFLELTNPPQNSVKLQWQQSIEGGAWTDVSSNGNGTAYTAIILSTAKYIDYRMQMSCGTSGQTSTSNVTRINRVGVPIYAKLPYFQGFENWENKCAIKDVPDSFWSAWPVTGISSWRREDEGLTADWKEDIVPIYYYPVSSEKSHSARFQCSKNNNSSGGLSLFLNCDGPGLKEARFDYMIKTMPDGANIFVLLSKDGGGTFDTITTLDATGVRAEWLGYVLPFNSTSATTVLKFVGYGAYTQSMDFDLGIDNLHVYPTCAEKPVVGTVDSLAACKGEGITLSLTGTSQSAGLTWLWQKTTDGISWVDLIGGGIERPNATLDEATWFRCIVTCTNSGLSDTSAPRLVTIKPFYNCYCGSGSTIASPSINIGNVKLSLASGGPLLIDNGNPLPATNNLEARKHYSDFSNLPLADIFRDSSYKVFLTFFTENGTNVSPIMDESMSKVFIDYNRNAKFEAGEQVWGHLKESDVYTDTCAFSVPHTAFTGITRMRIVTNSYDNWDTSLTTACGPYGYGETEDYLVRINDVPCKGNEVAGTITASDTSFCPGYSFTLEHSGADSTAGLIHRIWQSSVDGATWTDIANTDNNEVLKDVFAAAGYYRVKAVCGQNSASIYTDSIRLGQDVLCYCPSYATGGFAGAQDSSDFGSFKLGTIDLPMNGGHLNNPLAINKYFSYTHLPAPVLYADSTYSFSYDHILIRNDHADARVTLFIDYNANGTYDLPKELVYSGMSTSSTWHKTANITIPSDVTIGKETGMRLIINNDTAANVPSDEACGTYISGETEDFRVTFKKEEPQPISVGDLSRTRNSIHIFPNPATGSISVLYKGENLANGALKVHNVAGQLLDTLNFKNLITGSVLKLNLSNYSSGIYFITVESGGSISTGKVVVQ